MKQRQIKNNVDETGLWVTIIRAEAHTHPECSKPMVLVQAQG